jgi:hypothetical protein
MLCSIYLKSRNMFRGWGTIQNTESTWMTTTQHATNQPSKPSHTFSREHQTSLHTSIVLAHVLQHKPTLLEEHRDI